MDARRREVLMELWQRLKHQKRQHHQYADEQDGLDLAIAEIKTMLSELSETVG